MLVDCTIHAVVDLASSASTEIHMSYRIMANYNCVPSESLHFPLLLLLHRKSNMISKRWVMQRIPPTIPPRIIQIILKSSSSSSDWPLVGVGVAIIVEEVELPLLIVAVGKDDVAAADGVGINEVGTSDTAI